MTNTNYGDEVLKVPGTDPEAEEHIQRGDIYFDGGNHPDAAREYQRAVDRYILCVQQDQALRPALEEAQKKLTAANAG